jgi:hypothetical protein
MDDATQPRWWHHMDPISTSGGLSELGGIQQEPAESCSTRRARANGSSTQPLGLVWFGQDVTANHTPTGAADLRANGQSTMCYMPAGSAELRGNGQSTEHVTSVVAAHTKPCMQLPGLTFCFLGPADTWLYRGGTLCATKHGFIIVHC